MEKMQSNSADRRSSTNPVKVSMFDRDDKGMSRSDTRRTQTVKSKIAGTATESSIPRPRQKSCDRASTSVSTLKPSGKTPLRHGAAASTLPTGTRSLSTDRISSIGGKTAKKDQKLLTDKVHQASMLNKIDTYFNVNQLTHMLNSSGSIKPINLKMLIEVSNYLIKMLGVKTVLTITNYVEEMPKMAKKLHYPGVITKSWLKTANAMHSWPNVLCWICWLVETCEVKKIALEIYDLDNLPFVGDEKEVDTHKYNLISMIKFYNSWNDEKLDEEEALVEKYLEELCHQHGVTEEGMSNLQFELDENEQKLHAAEEKAQNIDEDIAQLQKILQKLKEDEKNQQRDIKAKKDYIKTVVSDTKKIKANCKILSEHISLRTKYHEDLLSKIKQQPMSKTEKESILEKCQKIQGYMQQFDEHLQDIQKESFIMDLTLSSVTNNVTKLVLTYNKEILVNFNKDMGVDINELKLPESGIFDPQSMDVLHAKTTLINDYEELMKKQIVEKERFIELSYNEMEDLQERMKILKDESSVVACALKEKKDLVNKMKTDFKSEEAKLKEYIKALQNEIKQIEDSIPDRQKVLEELEETADKLDAVRRQKEYIEESAKLFFDKFFSILGEHKNKLCKILGKLNK